MTPQPLQGSRTRSVLLLLLLVTGAVLVTPAGASSLDDGASPQAIAASVLASAETMNGSRSLLSSTLLDWLDRHGEPALQGTAGPEARTYVYVSLTSGTPTSVLDSRLSGIVDRDESSGLVTARVTAGELEALAGMPEVRQVREVDSPVLAAGKTTTAGDSVLRTDLLRTQYGLTGSGVRIGVISDGVESLAQAQATGDLPLGLHVLSNEQGGDEGTAMLEIVQDVAPGAELYFHDHGDSMLEFNRAVDALVAAGCTVIVDDVAWPREPFFEDGMIATHLAALLDSHEFVYVTAAGNYAQQHYQGAFRDDGEGFHDFSGTGSSRPYLYADLPAGSTLQVVLQWDEAFGSAADDFDLFLVDARTGRVLDRSTDQQNGQGDPLEALVWTNHNEDLEAAIVVLDAGGAGAGRTLEVYAYPSSTAGVSDENLVPDDGIYGHQAVADVVSVGAVSAVLSDQIEPFSSNGPVTHVSPSPTVRQKPDICGVDRVRVSGAGGFKSTFVGTSAASPHIGALCALVWSGRPDLTADEIRNALYRSATDLGAPGRDTVFGWGRADAVDMYALVATGTPTPTPTPVPVTPTPTPGAVVTPTVITPVPTVTSDTGFGRSTFGRHPTGYSWSGTGSPTYTVPTTTTSPFGSGGSSISPSTRPFQRWYPADRWSLSR